MSYNGLDTTSEELILRAQQKKLAPTSFKSYFSANALRLALQHLSFGVEPYSMAPRGRSAPDGGSWNSRNAEVN